MMSKISKKVSHYLIGRQRRAARLEAFGRAEEAGIVESKAFDTSGRCVSWRELLSSKNQIY